MADALKKAGDELNKLVNKIEGNDLSRSGLFFEEYGPKTAPTILFLHGGGGGRWMWQPQVERLTDYHLLIPDLPGHGDSAGIPLTSIENAGNRIARLIRKRAHGGKAHVVGLSLGAQVVVYLLAQTPERVEHAVVSSALLQTYGSPNGCTTPDFCDCCSIPLLGCSLFATAAGGRRSWI